jgi:hypothetical protein
MRYMAPMKPEQIPAVALPFERCVYCWYVLHPTLTYPACWSSTCCSAHRAWVLAHVACIRAARSSARAERAGSESLGGSLSVTLQMMEGHP